MYLILCVLKQRAAFFIITSFREAWPAAHLLPQQAAVVDRGQVSVMDLDELVQILRFLYLVLKLESCAVQNLQRHEDY